MRMRKQFKIFPLLLFAMNALLWGESGQNKLFLNKEGYFEMTGINVMAYQDFYPAGHQGGVTIIQNGVRVAANGDVRLEPAPGQWSPVPKLGLREVDTEKNEIRAALWYPDSSQDRTGFNPIVYPDLKFKYHVRVKPVGRAVHIAVDLEQPLPEEWYGKVGFNIELFPGFYFSKSWYMDEKFGVFPRQVNGPLSYDPEGRVVVKPLAEGKKLIVVPDNPDEIMAFEANGKNIALLDGRAEHNNGWFIVRTLLQKGRLKNAAELLITIGAQQHYKYHPVIHVSQVGYHPGQKKVAVIELDKNEEKTNTATLFRIREKGGLENVKNALPQQWGQFLRYRYMVFDFSEIRQPGMYKLKYGDVESVPFQISPTVYERHVWQPTLEYFLPVQMCHMRVNDRYKVWHGLCHNDDALMAPVDHLHFDGYKQGSSTLTKYKPFEPVPGLNAGGWHDAGDYDLRVESQARTVRILSQIYELFHPDYDVTTIDQNKKLVEMHRPDGKPDVLQQIEHGALTVVGGYKALGRLYRGIICSQKRQYTLLGDGSTMTDNLVYRGSGQMDDRWVFTEENPGRELLVSACLATGYRALKGFNDSLANDCLAIAKILWARNNKTNLVGLVDGAVELYISTGEENYFRFIKNHQRLVIKNVRRTAPAISRLILAKNDKSLIKLFRPAMKEYAARVEEMTKETPFGVEYTPNIWGAGWGIQNFGVNQYFLHSAFPDLFSIEPMLNALNFVLGVHPGSNSMSFVSGVGAESAIVAYGYNRAEWTNIPGGSVSGTALIRPDLPELKIWPYFWQQTEYVMGGGATNFMFLVLAADQLLQKK